MNPLEEGAERQRSSTDCDPEGRQRFDVLRTMRDVRESVAAHSPDHGSTGSRDEAEKIAECLRPEKRQVETECSFCPHGHGIMTMQPTPQESLYWECSTCSTTSGLSLDGCDVRLVDRRSFEGADSNMVPIETTRQRASERAWATERHGPGGVSPIIL